MRRSLVAGLALLAACASPAPPERTDAPSAGGPRTWSVAPILGHPELADALADALVRAHGVRLAGPGGVSRADRTLSVSILSHDPYDPPRTTMAVEIVRSDARSPGSLDHLVSSASWGAAVVPSAGSPAALKLVLDAREPSTRSAIDAFVLPGVAFAADEVRAVQSRWIEFLAHEVVRRIPQE